MLLLVHFRALEAAENASMEGSAEQAAQNLNTEGKGG
jgi:hypothetical protein